MEDTFDGVFRFTNATDEDFKALWNNKEYTFPAGHTVPLIIPDETLENIQAIRKKFAFKLAVREFYKGKEYQRLAKMGNGLPPTFDEKVLQPWVDQCLLPLPGAKAKVIEKPRQSDKDFRASKAVSDKDDLNMTFKDAPLETRGKMSDTAI